MKKVIALLLALAMCLSLLAGCGKKDKEPDDGKIEDMPNPVVTYANIQEQTDAMGIGLEAPEGASDVVYQSIYKMVETLFTYDGVQYFYRAEPTDKTEAYDISGLNYKWTGINYNLSSVNVADAESLLALAELIYVPLQGETAEEAE